MIQENVDIYNTDIILNKKSKVYIIIWIMFLVLFLSLLLLICVFYRFYEYETYLGYVRKNEDYKLVLYLKDFSKLNSYELYLENEKLEFSIYSISSDYYIIDGSNYYEIVLNVNLPNIYKIDNNILKLKMKKEETTYLKKIKEELNL